MMLGQSKPKIAGASNFREKKLGLLCAAHLSLRANDLSADVGKTTTDVPTRKVRAEFAQVADIADMISDAILLDIGPVYPLVDQFLDQIDAFQN